MSVDRDSSVSRLGSVVVGGFVRRFLSNGHTMTVMPDVAAVRESAERGLPINRSCDDRKTGFGASEHA
jgi:hypothetical protein